MGKSRSFRTLQPKAAPKRRRIVYDAVTFSEHDGIRYLHFGTEWVQGAMQLRKPDRIVLEYAQQMMAWMLFMPPPAHVVQLGLGTGALTKFCYRNFPATRVTAVELNPEVIAAAYGMFKLPMDFERLTVLEEDALRYVEDPANHGTVGALQVDLYDATARGPVLDSLEFYRACRACLTEPGMLTVNLFGEHASFGRNMRTLGAAFAGRVIALPPIHVGNRVALAFTGPPLEVEIAELIERASVIRRDFGLPAKRWVDGIKAVAGQHCVGGRFRI